MTKINVAELLQDCPKGMELYSPIYGLGILTKVTDRIHVKFSKEHNVKCFRPDGKVSENGEIMLYPKGKTTWEGFQRPYINGDIVYTISGNIAVLGDRIEEYSENFNSYCGLYNFGFGFEFDFDAIVVPERLATEEEKQKLFDAIKAKGYKWNAETKTLEKLIEPKFKVGDRIKNKNSGICDKVIKIFKDCYLVESCLGEQTTIGFNIQDNWELIPNKFDINTLIPFESRVLIRDYIYEDWKASFWGYLTNNFYGFNYDTIRGRYKQCIPYEGNEHLLGTTDDCNEYYKTWKE